MTDKTFSLEFFPTRTDKGAEKLRAVRQELYKLNPSYCSVTFGAGGSTQDGTLDTVREIQAEGKSEAAPHLSCIGTSKASVLELLNTYKAEEVKRLVALRGDMPSGSRDRGDFNYASELVEFIRAETGEHFELEVAAYPEFHPQAKSPDDDVENFVRKIDAGGNAGITQYFFNADAYFRFVDAVRAKGCDAPIVPGIMPITNYTQLARFSDACGAEIPKWIRERLKAFADDVPGIKAFGHDVVLELCEQLLANDVPGLHFYTLNQSDSISKLWRELELPTG